MSLEEDICELFKIAPAGGGLHIVLDDCNVEDEDIQWCIDNIDEFANSEYEKDLSMKIATGLLQISSENERIRIIDKAMEDINQ